MCKWNKALEENLRRISRGVLRGILFLPLTMLNKKERFSVVMLRPPKMKEATQDAGVERSQSHVFARICDTSFPYLAATLTTVSNLHRMLVVHLRCTVSCDRVLPSLDGV